jgi:hypothetical protein
MLLTLVRRNPWLRLPDELLILIFSHLDPVFLVPSIIRQWLTFSAWHRACASNGAEWSWTTDAGVRPFCASGPRRPTGTLTPTTLISAQTADQNVEGRVYASSQFAPVRTPQSTCSCAECGKRASVPPSSWIRASGLWTGCTITSISSGSWLHRLKRVRLVS